MAVDFHSHILPGIDDGSRSVEESISMLRLSARQGVREIILTPHFYPQRTTPERFLERRERSLQLLLEGIGGRSGLPALRTGAEVYFYPQMSHSEELYRLTIGGTRYVLVEMPMAPWSDRMYRELEDISVNLGLTPIVAHVDRYLGCFRDHGIPDRLAELPVLVQANSSFFQKPFTEGKAMGLLRDRRIHVLGSDCHNTTDRPPDLGIAVRRIRQRLGPKAIEWITRNERQILGTGNGDGV